MSVLLSAVLGVAGGALAARLAELRVYFVPVSVGFLGAGYYFAYWRKTGGRQQKFMLWVATPLTTIFWILPYVSK